jgi:hypothetical protein
VGIQTLPTDNETFLFFRIAVAPRKNPWAHANQKVHEHSLTEWMFCSACLFFLSCFFLQLLIWDDGLTVNSWPGYITAYVLMSMGIYLISDIDFLAQQNKDLQDYQEIILSDLYHPRRIFADTEALQAELTRASYEQTMNKHQLIIMDHSRFLGIKRGNSDPELHSLGSSLHGLEGCDRNARHGRLSSGESSSSTTTTTINIREQLAREMNQSNHSQTTRDMNRALSTSWHVRELNKSIHSKEAEDESDKKKKKSKARLSKSHHDTTRSTMASTPTPTTITYSISLNDLTSPPTPSAKRLNQMLVSEIKAQYQQNLERLSCSNSSHSISEEDWDEQTNMSGDTFGADDDDWDCEVGGGSKVVHAMVFEQKHGSGILDGLMEVESLEFDSCPKNPTLEKEEQQQHGLLDVCGGGGSDLESGTIVFENYDWNIEDCEEDVIYDA